MAEMNKRADFEDLVLVKATKEQWHRTHDHQVTEWGGGLSTEDFRRREETLCIESEFGKKGSFTGWVLVPKDDTTTLDFACSCEHYLRPIYIKDEEHPNGKEAKCAAICSVFTPENHRRKGYAQRMMVLLHEKLALHGDLSVLYSDVGTFYSKAKREHLQTAKTSGWEVVGPYQVVWPVIPLVSGSTTSTDEVGDAYPEGIRKLEESEFDEICKHDSELLKQELQQSKASKAFVILPTKDQIDWQIARCKFYDNVRHPISRHDYPFIDNWGCQSGNPDDPENWAFAIWTYDVILNELLILRLRCNSTKQLEAISDLAQVAARKQGMKKILAWNVDEKLLHGTNWKTEARTGHLPALAWYGDGEAPQWLRNEHWSWC